MKQQNEVVEIDFRELADVVIRKIWLILAVTLIGGLLAGLISYYLIEPKYKSTAKMYILTNSEAMVSLSDLQMGSSLANDYQELIKSRPVIETVISDLKLDMTYERMMGLISISNPTNTRIINITIEYTDPQIAMEIANKFILVAKQKISEIMMVDEPTIAEEAISAKAQSSPNNIRNAIIGAVLGMILSVGIIVLLYLMDDTIKSAEDVERYLGLNTLAAIPDEGGTDNTEKHRRKKQKKKEE